MKRQPQPKRKRDSRRGTTLVETMIAIMILGGTVGGACHMTVLAKGISDQAREHYQAINVARNQLERMRVLGFDQLSACAEAEVRVDSNGAVNPNGHFRRTTSITVLASDLKEAKVVVDVMNRISLDFNGGSEEISSLMTRFRTAEA